MTITGKTYNILIIDDPFMMDRKPVYVRSEFRDLTWTSNGIDQSWVCEERDRIMKENPDALVTVESYHGNYRVKVKFDNKEDEDLFIMREH